MAGDANSGAPQAKGGLMGMPVWVWGVGVGAVVLFLWYRKSHGAASSSLPGQPLSGGVVTDPNTGFPIDPQTGLPYITSQTGPASTNTIEGWITSAEQALRSAGYNPLLVEQALYDFTNGNHLSNREEGVIQRALRLIGHPPELLPILGNIPAPPRPVPKKPTTAPKAGTTWWFSAKAWRWVQRAIPGYKPSPYTWPQKPLVPVHPSTNFLTPIKAA